MLEVKLLLLEVEHLLNLVCCRGQLGQVAQPVRACELAPAHKLAIESGYIVGRPLRWLTLSLKNVKDLQKKVKDIKKK